MRRWRGRPENREYWSGPENVARARAWQKEHPNYAKGRKKRVVVLQNVWQTQPPLLLGLISRITGSVLQHDMAEITGQLIANGRALVGPNH